MDYRIQDTVGFTLAQLCKAHRYAVDEALREHGLRAGQEMILLQLWAGEGLTQTELAERLAVEPPTVTRMLQRMEAEQLLERRPDPDDARVSRVYLTQRGRSLEAAVTAAWQAVDERLTAGMTLEERLLLRRILAQGRANLCRFPA
ncbi:MAG: MarR family transcriptional regulator [Chloroflexi bacterium OHK40]